jgi:hypothetical protein
VENKMNDRHHDLGELDMLMRIIRLDIIKRCATTGAGRREDLPGSVGSIRGANPFCRTVIFYPYKSIYAGLRDNFTISWYP